MNHFHICRTPETNIPSEEVGEVIGDVVPTKDEPSEAVIVTQLGEVEVVVDGTEVEKKEVVAQSDASTDEQKDHTVSLPSAETDVENPEKTVEQATEGSNEKFQPSALEKTEAQETPSSEEMIIELQTDKHTTGDTHPEEQVSVTTKTEVAVNDNTLGMSPPEDKQSEESKDDSTEITDTIESLKLSSNEPITESEEVPSSGVEVESGESESTKISDAQRESKSPDTKEQQKVIVLLLVGSLLIIYHTVMK